jgi:hypothetical protein
MTSVISDSVLIAEYYIGQSMQNATIATKYYLQSVGGLQFVPDRGNKDLEKFQGKLGVGNIAIYGIDGFLRYTTSNTFAEDPGYFKKRNIFVCQGRKKMINEAFAFALYPLRSGLRKTFTYQDFAGQSWFKDSKVFIGVSQAPTNLGIMLKNRLSSNCNTKRIVISSPSGVVLMDTDDLGKSINKNSRSYVSAIFNNYEEIPITRHYLRSIEVSIPFGGLKDNCKTLHDDHGDKAGLANSSGQYFYVMNVTFDRTVLNTQIAIISLICLALCTICCLYVHTKHKLMLSLQDSSNNVFNLSNQRLKDVRRYVERITKDLIQKQNEEQQEWISSGKMWNEFRKVFDFNNSKYDVISNTVDDSDSGK